jgi:hypothetical protein
MAGGPNDKRMLVYHAGAIVSHPDSIMAGVTQPYTSHPRTHRLGYRGRKLRRGEPRGRGPTMRRRGVSQGFVGKHIAATRVQAADSLLL